MGSEGDMTVIAHPSPTLQTLDMDKPNSVHRGTIPTAAISGMVTNRTINVVLAKGLEGSLEEVLQLCGLKPCELSLHLDHSEH